jgi:hypothetical protein
VLFPPPPSPTARRCRIRASYLYTWAHINPILHLPWLTHFCSPLPYPSIRPISSPLLSCPPDCLSSYRLNAFGFSTAGPLNMPLVLDLPPPPSSTKRQFSSHTQNQNQFQNQVQGLNSRAKVISDLDNFLEFGQQTHTQAHTPSRVGSAVKGSGSGPGSAHHTQSAVGDTGGPARKAKSAGTPKKRAVSRSKAVNSNSNNNGTNNVTSGHGHSGSNNFNNTNHTGVNTHNNHTNSSSSDHQSSRPLSAHRPRAQSVGHNLESRGLGDGSGTRGERKQASQLHQEKHFTPTRGQAQTGFITHTPIAHIHTSTMPSPSSRYEEQLRNSLESLVFESISSVEQESARARPPAPHMRGSPQRPRSAPSPVSGSPMSLRGKGGNGGLGLGLGLDGTSNGKERGGGIAALGRGESNRRVSPRSHSTDRVRHDAGRDGQGQGLGTRAAFSDAPIYLPQRISGRPPMTPSHAHTPMAPRAAPHSTMKSTGNRPVSHSSVPSYARA